MGQLARIMLLTSVLVVTGALVAVAQPPVPSKPKPAPAAGSHKMITPDQIKWGPAPPSLPSRIPKTMHHFVQAKGETIIQVSGMGPFVVNYVNPSDDPRKTVGTK